MTIRKPLAGLTSLAAAAMISAVLPAASAAASAHHSGLVIHPPTAAQRAAHPNFLADVTSVLNFTSCLDVLHSGTANFTNVDIYQCNNTAAQSWNFLFLGNTYLGPAYEIKAGVGTNMCLDVFHSGTADYTNVDIFQCNQNASQIWVASGDNLLSAVDPNGNTCLDVFHSGTANYTNVDIHQCNGTDAQAWDY